MTAAVPLVEAAGTPLVLPRLAKSPIRYAGGKGAMVGQYNNRGLLPQTYRHYYEPFLGGGALFFALSPPMATIGDLNPDLMCFYRVVRAAIPALVEAFSQWDYTRETFARVRALHGPYLDEVTRAARFLYLNKVAFNGLWRVNSRGEFNTPYGLQPHQLAGHGSHAKLRKRFLNLDNLERVQALLRCATLQEADYRDSTADAGPGSFVFMDPPYLPRHPERGNFSKYTAQDFKYADHVALAAYVRELDRRGVQVLVANADAHAIVPELYRGFELVEVTAFRCIASAAGARGLIKEYAIRNYA